MYSLKYAATEIHLRRNYGTTQECTGNLTEEETFAELTPEGARGHIS